MYLGGGKVAQAETGYSRRGGAGGEGAVVGSDARGGKLGVVKGRAVEADRPAWETTGGPGANRCVKRDRSDGCGALPYGSI